MRYLSLIAFSGWMCAGVPSVMAQAKPQIQVLQMPPEMQALPVTKAEGLLSVHFDGHVAPGRTIYVRVFRDPLDQLLKQQPRNAGECVVYTHASRFRVDHSFDRELRLTDLITFFRAAAFQNRQVLTLVFEEGDDPESNGPLRLQAGSVADYFRNAVQMTLLATDDIKAQWDVAEQRAEQQMAEMNKQPSAWDRLFGQKAAAKQQISPPKPQPAPISAKVFLPPCQKVSLIKFTPLAAQNTPAQAGLLEALGPVAVRGDDVCSQ